MLLHGPQGAASYGTGSETFQVLPLRAENHHADGQQCGEPVIPK